MASSFSRKLSRAILSRYPAAKPSALYQSFCTKSISSDSDSESPHVAAPNSYNQRNTDRPLENGLDHGIYKAILVGEVGQTPIPKKLRSGKTVTLISLGTGGMRNNRRPLDNEEPREYANRCAVQWHRVSVYPERLGELAAKNLVPGTILYVEGNLESKVFTDPITGLVRRIREVAVRLNGRILVLGKTGEGGGGQFTKADMAGFGYY
ncbi:hypothetical protein ACS0TY_027796 [Phlomoides rotata]